MKKNRIGKMITILSIITITIEVGIATAYYMLTNIDFNKYDDKYSIEVIK